MIFNKLARTGLVRTARITQKRTFIPDSWLQQPNRMIEKQKFIQGGATPFLRGAADPTYWRTKGDNAVVAFFGVATVAAWGVIGYSHYSMWQR